MSEPTVSEIFSATGPLAQASAGYRVRPAQIAMAEAVEDAILGEEHLAVHAPTGSGKSYALLVAATKATGEGQTVIVVTPTIALQTQYVAKDIPHLQRVLPWTFEAALLKGRGRYVCRIQLHTQELIDDDETERVRDSLATLLDGDYAGHPDERLIRERFARGGDECLGHECRLRDTCHYEVAKEHAGEADVIVVNASLFLQDRRLLRMTGRGLLPTPGVVIVDEAHRLAEIGRQAFGYSIGQRTFTRIATELFDHGEARLAQRLASEGEAFLEALIPLARANDRRITPDTTISHVEIHEALRESAAALSRLAQGAAGEDEELAIRNVRDRASALATDIESAFEGSDAIVYFASETRSGATLDARLVSPADVLRATLFDEVPSVICTSATLAAGDSFEYFCADTGFEGGRQMILDSPFDLAHQARLIVPPMPDAGGASRDAHAAAVPPMVVQIVRLAKGRTLSLHTSNAGVRRTSEALREAVLDGITIIEQKPGDDVAKLVARFREDVSSVLVATRSAFEGIDVPGEALSVLCLDRLPFEPPGDPVTMSIEERINETEGDRWAAFQQLSVPRAVVVFSQAVGRLLRSETDRGVVVVLDNRIATKPYGRMFQAALGFIDIESDIAVIEEFLEAGV